MPLKTQRTKTDLNNVMIKLLFGVTNILDNDIISNANLNELLTFSFLPLHPQF